VQSLTWKNLNRNCTAIFLKEISKLAITIKFLTLTLLFIMILACAPTFVGAKPEWQADTTFKVKDWGITPDSLGANHPLYAPLDIHEAYHIPIEGDSGTIAIIDAYDNPKAAADLAYFDQVFTWPTANLEVHKMSSLISPNAGWALESDLDIQWAHAVAPHAKILLIEAKSNSMADLMAAVDYANSRPDVTVVSMSWGGNENSGQIAYDNHFNSAKAYFASSGDVGGVVSWPSSSPNVVSVGGTSLVMTTTGYTETAWSSGGGGVSTIEAVPTYQGAIASAKSFSMRATPDVSYNADPNNGFLVYDSYGYNGGRGWFAVGGTSAGAPQWAALYTFGKGATNTNYYTNYPSYGTAFTDIISGSNTYNAKTGYDLATGIGSPLGVTFTASGTPDFSITASPSIITISTAKPTGTATINVNSKIGFDTDVSLTATDDNSAGLVLTFSPTTISKGSGSSTLTITLPAGITADTYPITISGTATTTSSSGTKTTITHTASLTVQVVTPSFDLSANPTSLSIRRGSTSTSIITVSPINGYTGTPTLSVASNPSGLTPTISTVSSGKATMTIRTTAQTPTTAYTVTITGTDGKLSDTVQVKVTVTAR
jgi:subtilase family serine protease